MPTMPGIDLMQQWMQTASSAVPGLPAWASSTLDPDELGKRIEELRTVQFWLEQNTKLIASSIQALEVQRMTLTTLKNLQVPAADIGAAFRMPAAAAASTHADAKADAHARAEAGAAGAAADPVQWWGNLTQQFSSLASQAMKDSAATAEKVSKAVAQASAASPAARKTSRAAASKSAKPKAAPRKRPRT